LNAKVEVLLGAPWYRAMWARRSDYDWEPPRWLAAGVVGVAVVLYVAVAWSARYPAIPLDEVVMVGNSRVVAGLPADWPLSGAGFMPGLAILMAPAWWFTSSAVVVYQVGIWITVALALLAILPLSAIAVRARLSRPAGVIVATVVVMAPARSLLSNYLLAESGLLLATAALVVAADRLWVLRRSKDALWFGVAVGAVVLFHGRGVGTAVAAGLWTLLLLRRDPKRAILAGATAIVAAIVAYSLYLGVTSEVIAVDVRVESAFGDLANHEVRASIASVAGQLWYATIAWPAIAILGGMATIRWRRRGGMAPLILLGSALGLFVSTVQLDPHSSDLRMDPWIYGRYMDTWWAILAVLGLAVLVRVKWAIMSAVVFVASAFAGLAMLWVTVPSMPKGVGWGDVHILGITPWLRLDAYANGRDQAWGVIVMTGIGLTVLLLALGFIRVWVLPTLALLWLWLSLAQDAQGIDLRAGDRGSILGVPGLELFPTGTPVGVDQDLGLQANELIFAADPTRLVKVDALRPPNGVDVVYVSWLRANDAPLGVKLLAPTMGSPTVAWIEPGHLADRLEAASLLLEPDRAPAAGAPDTGTPGSKP